MEVDTSMFRGRLDRLLDTVAILQKISLINHSILTHEPFNQLAAYLRHLNLNLALQIWRSSYQGLSAVEIHQHECICQSWAILSA